MRQFSGQMDVMSLRKRFELSGDSTLLLVARTYMSKRGGGHCRTMGLLIHDSENSSNPDQHRAAACDAVVLNPLGQGACLSYGTDGSTLGFARTLSEPQLRAVGLDTGVDHFMWRRLLKQNAKNGVPVWDELAWTHFSPKCSEGPTCAAPGRVYLPDFDFFFP
jgi:hypothetical protein